VILHESLVEGDRRASVEVRPLGARRVVRLRWESLTGSVIDERAEVFDTVRECVRWLVAGEDMHPDEARMAASLATGIAVKHLEPWLADR
jgi:hypothetical protein